MSLKVEMGTVGERWQGQSQRFLSEEQVGWVSREADRERRGQMWWRHKSMMVAHGRGKLEDQENKASLQATFPL